MTYARADLVNKAVANLGIVQQADAGATRTRAELVSEAQAVLGIVQQADAGATLTRSDLVTQALNSLGVVQQAVSSGTKVRNDLINDALYKLGAISVGTPASAEDVSTIDGLIDTTLADLAARFIVPASISAAVIPNAWFNSISWTVANAAKGNFGVSGEEEKAIIAQAALAEQNLKTVTRTGLVDGTIPSVIAELNARGIATVTNLAAIPAAWFQSLADIVADNCKASFDNIPQDLAQRAQASAERGERILIGLNRAPFVDEKLPSILAELNARGIATVSNIGAIPAAWFSALADIVADSCKAKFPLVPEVAGDLAARAARGERILKNLNRLPFVEFVVDATLAELAANDIVIVSDDSDIPQEWFLSLASVLAERAKGYFELDAETLMRVMQEGATAIATLREITRSRPSYLTQQVLYI